MNTCVIDFVPRNYGINLNRDVTQVSPSIRKVSSLVLTLFPIPKFYTNVDAVVLIGQMLFVLQKSEVA